MKMLEVMARAGLGLAVGLAPACGGDDGGGETDVAEDSVVADATVFAVQLSDSVPEHGRFVLTVQALRDDNQVATNFAGEVSVSTDWGDLELESPLILTQGAGNTVATLNRAGAATLTLTGGDVVQTASILVTLPNLVLTPEKPVLAPVVISGPDDQNHWTASGTRYPHVMASASGGFTAYFTSPGDITSPDTDDAGSVLGRAVAPNEGVNFELSPEDPLLSAGDLGLFAIADPFVLHAGDQWHLWLSAQETDSGPWFVAYATGSDGLTWQRDTCFEVRADPARTWMSSGARDPSAVETDDGAIRLYFAGLPNNNGAGAQIGYVQGDCAAGLASPILAFEKGPNQSWEERGATQPFVWRDGSVWKLLYVGQPSTGGATALGYATSADGAAWERAQAEPVFARNANTSSPSALGVAAPSYGRLESGRAVLFFEQRNFQERASLGRAQGPKP